MTDHELMQEALDALTYVGDAKDIYSDTIEALRARLKQPKPWVKTYSGGKPNYTQPIEQEPVAWGVDEGEGRCISLHDLYFVKEDADHMAELKGTHAKVVALYTAPPKKEWVGLTDKEIEDCLEMSIQGTCRAIEAKLKEKNT